MKNTFALCRCHRVHSRPSGKSFHTRGRHSSVFGHIWPRTKALYSSCISLEIWTCHSCTCASQWFHTCYTGPDDTFARIYACTQTSSRSSARFSPRFDWTARTWRTCGAGERIFPRNCAAITAAASNETVYSSFRPGSRPG